MRYCESSKVISPSTAGSIEKASRTDSTSISQLKLMTMGVVQLMLSVSLSIMGLYESTSGGVLLTRSMATLV